MVQLRGPDDPIVDVHLKTRDGQLAELGDDVDGIAEVELPLHVTGGNGTFVQVWRDGAKLVDLPVTSDDFTTTATDAPPAGDHRYRVELTDPGDQRLVVTSHIYVHAIAARPGGCAAAAPDAPLALLPVLALAWRRRRRR
jgi:uncharacterized protein (TIGR03382 family)